MPCLWALYLVQNVYCSVCIVIIASLFVFHYDILTNHVHIASYCYMGYRHVLCMEGGREWYHVMLTSYCKDTWPFSIAPNLTRVRRHASVKPQMTLPGHEGQGRSTTMGGHRSFWTGCSTLFKHLWINLNLIIQPTNSNLPESGWSTLRGKAFWFPSPIILPYLWHLTEVRHDDSMWHAWHEMPGEIETTLVVRTRLGHRTSVT